MSIDVPGVVGRQFASDVPRCVDAQRGTIGGKKRLNAEVVHAVIRALSPEEVPISAENETVEQLERHRRMDVDEVGRADLTDLAKVRSFGKESVERFERRR